MKKLGLLVMPLIAISLLGSCNKNDFSLENVTKWVEEHYTKEGTITPKSGKMVIDFSETTGEQMRDSVRNDYLYITELDENLRGEAAMPILQPQFYLNGKTFKERFTKEAVEERGITFDIKNDQLTITFNDSNVLIAGEVMQIYEHDKDGAPIAHTVKYVGAKIAGIDGVRTGYEKTTVTY